MDIHNTTTYHVFHVWGRWIHLRPILIVFVQENGDFIRSQVRRAG